MSDLRASQKRREWFLSDMEKLMDHHVVNKCICRHNELPVEGKTVVRRTGAPLSTCCHKSDLLWYEIELSAVMEHSFCDLLPGLCFVPRNEETSCFAGMVLGQSETA